MKIISTKLHPNTTAKYACMSANLNLAMHCEQAYKKNTGLICITFSQKMSLMTIKF